MIHGLVQQLGSILIDWFQGAATRNPAQKIPPVKSASGKSATASHFVNEPQEPASDTTVKPPPLWRNRNNAHRKVQAGDRVHIQVSDGNNEALISNCIVIGSSERDYQSVQGAYGKYFLVVDASGEFYEVGREAIQRPKYESFSWMYQPTLPQILSPYFNENSRFFIPVRNDTGTHFHHERVASPFRPGEKVYFPTAYLKNGPVAKNTDVYALVEFPNQLHRDDSGEIYLLVREELRDSFGRAYTTPQKVPLSALRGEKDPPHALWNKLHAAS